MIPDIDKYLPFLDQYDWPKKDKIEIIHAVWRMMEAQADKAFGLSAVQLSCGQSKNITSQNQQSTLDSKNSPTQKFRPIAANDDIAPKPSEKGGQNAA